MIGNWKWPRFRFSILTLLIAFVPVSLWLGVNVHQLRQREAISRHLLSLKAKVVYGPPAKPWKPLPLSWELLGVKTVSSISLPTGNDTGISHEDIEPIKAWFPEAQLGYYDPTPH